jgi:hypothetical protein
MVYEDVSRKRGVMPTAVYLNGSLWSRRSLLSRKRGGPSRSTIGIFARSSSAPAENRRHPVGFNMPSPTTMLFLLKGPKNGFRPRLRQSSFKSCCQSISRKRQGDRTMQYLLREMNLSELFAKSTTLVPLRRSAYKVPPPAD